MDVVHLSKALPARSLIRYLHVKKREVLMNTIINIAKFTLRNDFHLSNCRSNKEGESIQTGLQKGFQAGTFKMTQRKCYCYSIGQDGKLVINPDETNTVRWIFNRFFNSIVLARLL